MSYQVFKTEKTFLMIKRDSGKLEHIETTVTYAYDYDDCAPDFDYGSDEENKKEMKRFESGELLNLSLKVTAKCLGEYGYEYLGQCFVSSNGAEKELLDIASQYDLKNNACNELKNNILVQWELMKKHLL